MATVRRKRCRAGQLRDPVGDAHADSAARNPVASGKAAVDTGAAMSRIALTTISRFDLTRAWRWRDRFADDEPNNEADPRWQAA